MPSLNIKSSQRSFNGLQNVYSHTSLSCKCEMTFALYLPPQAEIRKVPLLWFLSGLTCTHENAMTKAHFQQYAAKYGIALLFPDTSPRGEHVPDDEAFDLGQGASFYLNATKEPWAENFQMYEYLNVELQELVQNEFPQLDLSSQGIFGHSMGGHGALVLALRNPNRYRSLSAFAPICNPIASEWGRKQFQAYLGNDESLWNEYDASCLMKKYGWNKELLVEQGSDDQFIKLLSPESLNRPGSIKYQEGYDHSYFFISSFADRHIEWHSQWLLE